MSKHLLTFASLVLLIFVPHTASAQSTAFTYQGKLTDTGTPANGNYDFQFKLFDMLSGGTQQGTTQTVPNVAVASGIFTIQIDFGVCASCFDGAVRFLEIAAKKMSDSTYTVLSPRQPISSTPYTIKTVNLTFNGPYNVPGTAFNASNTFAGEGAGVNTMPDPNIASGGGKFNSFFGAGAGKTNTTGVQNAFFGTSAGFKNLTGGNNSFFGYRSGFNNDSGSGNSFLGTFAGQNNLSGNNNNFVGVLAGSHNTIGSSNIIIGVSAGNSNEEGNNNTFIGHNTASLNDNGSNNTAIGYRSDFVGVNSTGTNNTILGTFAKATGNLSNQTAIGAQALVTLGNSLVLGSINGVNGATADTNVGIGTTAPTSRLDVSGTGGIRARVNSDVNAGLGLSLNNQLGWSVATVIPGQFQIFNDSISQNAVWIDNTNNNFGIGVAPPADKLHVFGDIRAGTSGTNGCLKNNNGGMLVGTCSSDVRFKRDITPFPSLLAQLVQLRPVTFYWRTGDYPDRHFGRAQEVGLIAQEVERVMPELVSEDEQGYKAINYAKLPLLSLQAIKELKTDNDALKQENRKLAGAVESLKKLVCLDHPTADVCR